jgi:hypothetical protein
VLKSEEISENGLVQVIGVCKVLDANRGVKMNQNVLCIIHNLYVRFDFGKQRKTHNFQNVVDTLPCVTCAESDVTKTILVLFQ